MLNRLSPSNTIEPKDEVGFDLSTILNFGWRQWKFISIIVAMTIVIGVVYLLQLTPRYTATTQVLLEPRKEKVAGSEAFLSDANLDNPSIESQMAIIRSAVLLRHVVDKENLVFDSEFGSRRVKGRSWLEMVRGLFNITQSKLDASAGAKQAASGSSDQATPQELASTTRALSGALAVSRSGLSYIISISVTSVDPARAAKLANAIADAYLVDKLDARFEAAKRASSWLSDRLVELRKQVRSSEEAVLKFRSEHNLVQSGANVTLNQQQLSELSAKLVAARSEAAEKKARVELLQSIVKKGGTPESLPDFASGSPTLNALRTQEAGISQREADLVTRYGDRHPLVVNVRAERRDIQRAIAAEIQRLVANVANEYELAKTRADSILQSLREVTGQTELDSQEAITLRELERTAAVNKSLFEDFLQRAKITDEQSTFEAKDARVITQAVAPSTPSYPRKAQSMIFTVIIGTLLGIACAVAKEKLNVGFATPRQVEEMLDTPVLASISRLVERDLTIDGKVIKIQSFPVIKPLSRYSESIRALRSGVQMTDVDNPPKVIQLTSTMPSEGKTTIALSFATSAATSGLKVLFIDADLRHPSASRLLGLAKDDAGLVDLLLGSANSQDAIRYIHELKFWALAGGSKTQNPPDMLGSDRMKSLIMSFKQSFDMIVIDTPPAGPVIDPVVVSQLVDKVVFVVRWAATAREMVVACLQQFSGPKKIAGVVFNQVVDSEAQKYGKYAYQYYYGSRYYGKYYNE